MWYKALGRRGAGHQALGQKSEVLSTNRLLKTKARDSPTQSWEKGT